METSDLFIGQVLLTKNSQKFSNAVVMDKKDNKYTILSDFGNQMKMDFYEIYSHYYLCSEYIFAKQNDMPLPHRAALKERLETQFELIKVALIHIKE